MASLTSPRNTVVLLPQQFGSLQPMAAGATAVQGCLVALNGDGYGNAASMTKATSLKCVGIANESVDNSAGIAAAQSVVCLTGLVLLDNGTSTDTITQADVGNLCYALDNHTVSRVSTGASAVGTIRQIVGAGDVGAGQIVVEIDPV